MTEQGIKFVQHMVDVYGVRSCFDNLGDGTTLEEEGLWFECPHCGDPILIGDDWTLEEVSEMCPICEEYFD